MRQTHFGTAPVKIVGKGSVKSTGIKHYSVRVKTPEGILQEVEEVHHRTKFYARHTVGKYKHGEAPTHCAQCGDDIIGRRHGAKYCSVGCRILGGNQSR